MDHIIWYLVISRKDTLLEAFYGNFLTVNNMTTKQWKEAIRQNVRFKCFKVATVNVSMRKW